VFGDGFSSPDVLGFPVNVCWTLLRLTAESPPEFRSVFGTSGIPGLFLVTIQAEGWKEDLLLALQS
jgi:hypothetical protein